MHMKPFRVTVFAKYKDAADMLIVDVNALDKSDAEHVALNVISNLGDSKHMRRLSIRDVALIPAEKSEIKYYNTITNINIDIK